MFAAIWLVVLTVVALVALCIAIEPAYREWKSARISNHIDQHKRTNAAEHWISYCTNKPCKEATEFFQYETMHGKDSVFYIEKSAKLGREYFSRYPEQKPKPPQLQSSTQWNRNRIDWRKRLREEEEQKIREEQAKNIVENGVGKLKVFRG